MKVELALFQIKSMTSSRGSGHSSSEKRGKDSTFVSMNQISTPKNFISNEYFCLFPKMCYLCSTFFNEQFTNNNK